MFGPDAQTSHQDQSQDSLYKTKEKNSYMKLFTSHKGNYKPQNRNLHKMSFILVVDLELIQNLFQFFKLQLVFGSILHIQNTKLTTKNDRNFV